MRTFLLTSVAAIAIATGAANAADLPNGKAPPIFVITGTNWSGFYIGANWGVARGANTWTDPTGFLLVANTPRFPARGDQNGIFGGATAGWNYQTGPWVLGVEADVSLASTYGAAVCGGAFGVGGMGWKCRAANDLLASLTARTGHAVGRALIYGKAGLAYSHDKYEIAGLAAPGVMAQAQGARENLGWTVGAGVEYALGGNWAAKAEYDYYNLRGGLFTGTDAVNAAQYGARVSHTQHLFKFGLNYRFGGSGGSVSAPAPLFADDLSGEFGTRIGYTTGFYVDDLKAPANSAQMNSRLSWAGQSGLALEGFARIDHMSGVFAKGFLGGTNIFSAHMHDEDYPPDTAPYSNTISSTRNGNGLYGVADLGWAWRRAGWRLGAFVGYSHNEERLHAYGCTQTYLAGICAPSGSIPGGMNILSRYESWNALRIGFAGEVMVTDRLKLSADVAYLPLVGFKGHDNHWARPDINPMTDSAHGYGYQIEGVASYLVTDRWSVGVGARYWYAKADGTTQFPFMPASPTIYKNGRTTVFVQSSYAFGGHDAPPVVAKY